MRPGLHRVTFEGFHLGEREAAALAEAGFEIKDYRAGGRSEDPESITSGKYFAEVCGHADDPASAVEAVRAALGGEPSAFSNFRAERMIAIGPRGALARDRRDD